jgi:hypothetical protein
MFIEFCKYLSLLVGKMWWLGTIIEMVCFRFDRPTIANGKANLGRDVIGASRYCIKNQAMEEFVEAKSTRED